MHLLSARYVGRAAHLLCMPLNRCRSSAAVALSSSQCGLPRWLGGTHRAPASLQYSLLAGGGPCFCAGPACDASPGWQGSSSSTSLAVAGCGRHLCCGSPWRAGRGSAARAHVIRDGGLHRSQTLHRWTAHRRESRLSHALCMLLRHVSTVLKSGRPFWKDHVRRMHACDNTC